MFAKGIWITISCITLIGYMITAYLLLCVSYLHIFYLTNWNFLRKEDIHSAKKERQQTKELHTSLVWGYNEFLDVISRIIGGESLIGVWSIKATFLPKHSPANESLKLSEQLPFRSPAPESLLRNCLILW